MTAVTFHEESKLPETTMPAAGGESPARASSSLDTVEWVLWSHHLPRHTRNDKQWRENTSEIAHFFAHHCSFPYSADLGHLPLPSEHFFLKNQRGENYKAPPKHIEYSLFKKDTEPSWSDEHCKGELYTKHYFPPELLDMYWQALAEGVMDGKIDDDHIVAIRVVDKSHAKHPMYKLEMWLDTTKQQVRDKIRNQAMNCIPMDEHHRFKFHWRDFEAESGGGGNKNSSKGRPRSMSEASQTSCKSESSAVEDSSSSNNKNSQNKKNHSKKNKNKNKNTNQNPQPANQ